MKFGFDIDDTLINLRGHAFELYKKKLGKEVGDDVFEALLSPEIHGPFGLTSEQGKEMWNSTGKTFISHPALLFLMRLKCFKSLYRTGMK